MFVLHSNSSATLGVVVDTHKVPDSKLFDEARYSDEDAHTHARAHTNKLAVRLANRLLICITTTFKN